MTPSDILVQLEHRIEALWPIAPSIASEQRSWQRQHAAVHAAFPVIERLIEPWNAHPQRETITRLTLSLHLYARILDDAIDEGLNIHRRMALRAQSIFAKSMVELTQCFDERAAGATSLIEETIAANDEVEATPELWGRKNHHLLIASWLAAPTSEEFDAIKPALSNYLLVLQAAEEMTQPQLDFSTRPRRIEATLTSLVEPGWIDTLYAGGWQAIAHDIPGLLSRLIARIDEKVV